MEAATTTSVSLNTEFVYQGKLEGHANWVTQIVTGHAQKENEDSSVLVSGSRDKTLMVWKLYESPNDGYYGAPYKSLTGHEHFISDIALSHDNSYAISSSWDRTLRLWDLRAGKTTYRFNSHTREVFTACFAQDSRMIFSAGADNSIKLWNVRGDCKYTSEAKNHTDWISCVRYCPGSNPGPTGKAQIQPYIASVGWDGYLKIWNQNLGNRYTFKAHDGNINACAISPNPKLIATGGKDKILHIWDVTNLTAPVFSLEAGCTINSIAFHPITQWIVAGTDQGIKIWDFSNEKAGTKPFATLEPIQEKSEKVTKKSLPSCTSVAWNSSGKKLFAGFTDGLIRVYHVQTEKN
jgi:guanine nucleotide-binding protein subunit beta-2-like 1 protein